MKSAWDTIETSVGPLDIKACARSYFNIQESEGEYSCSRRSHGNADWEIDGPR